MSGIQTPGTPAAPAAVPQPAANVPATQPAGSSYEADYAAAKARIVEGMGAADAGAAPLVQAAEQTPSWDEFRPKAPAAPSIEEHIKARIEARKNRSRPQAPATPDVYKAQLEQLQAQQAQADAEFRAHIEKGDVKSALQVKGVSKSLEELQTIELKRLGMIQTVSDPRLTEVDERLTKWEKEQRAQQAKFERERKAAQEAQQALQDVQAVAHEMSNWGIKGARELAEVPGMPETTLDFMVNHGLGLKEAAAATRDNCVSLYAGLRKWALAEGLSDAELFPGEQQAQAPQQPPPRRPVVPTGSSSGPLVPADMPYEEAKALTRRLFIEGKI